MCNNERRKTAYMSVKDIEKVDLSLDNEDFFERYGRKKIVSMFTLGCKVNQYESEAVSSLLEKAGYEIVDEGKKADIYIINTCTVTGISARKSRQMIRRAKSLNNNSIIAVMGCYSQTSPEEVSNIPGVNLIIGTSNRNRIAEYLDEIFNISKNQVNKVQKMEDTKIKNITNIMKNKEFEDLHLSNYKERTRAYIKIQEGCTQFCSYCIIPYARGPIRSRNVESVVEEVLELADNNFKEIVLTGIHVASYGKDLGNTSLEDIVKRIHDVDGIERIRLSSIEPTIFDDSFVQTIKSLKKLCPHYHISLQSGCDETLKRMNRKYNTKEYKDVIERLRDNIEDIAITTDVMVGFPGETDKEFETTYEFLRKIGFSKMHIFKYSPRKGTPAASFPNQISGKVKDERSNRLIRLSNECSLNFHKKFLGREMPILFEKQIDNNSYGQLNCTSLNLNENVIEGLSPNYIRVFCNGNNNLKGEIQNVVLKEVKDEVMIGEIIK